MTLMGEELRVTLDGTVTVLNETVTVDDISLEATNGFIHVLDGVLDPDVRSIGSSVMATLRGDGEFSRFVRLWRIFHRYNPDGADHLRYSRRRIAQSRIGNVSGAV